jgi:hypothetical protein
MPVTLKGIISSFFEEDKSTPNGREDMTVADLKKEKLDYQAEPIYFQRREDFGKLPEDNPGTKFNRAQMDAIIYARNTGVSMGLFSKEDGDMFLATQLREARNDFGVNPNKPDGSMQTISINQGKTREAAGSLFGVGPEYDNQRKVVQGLEYFPPDRSKEKGAEVLPKVKRVETEKMYSPYTSEKMTPEDYQYNAKLALLTYLSKKDKGESASKVAKDWNGKGVNKDLGANANNHLKEVLKAKEDLLHPNNKSLREYISERLSDDNSIYRIKPKK